MSARVGWVLTLVAVWVASVLGAAVLAEDASTEPREITVFARQYGYEPSRIVANVGETLRLRLVSRDVVHGFFLEGHDLDARILPGRIPFEVRKPSETPAYSEVPVGGECCETTGGNYTLVEDVLVKLDRPGKFRYRCSVTCGPLHPFMQGELVVRPNLPFIGGTAGVILIGAGLVGWMFMPVRPRSERRRRFDLLKAFPWLRWLVTRRWFQFALVFPSLLVLVFFIAAGLFGSPIGNRNIAVTIVWILWWFLLITLMVPLGGRVWCLACPIPAVGEWMSRRRLVGVSRPERRAPAGTARRRLRWPAPLKGIWLQNFLFIGMCSVSTILVTRPAWTAVVLAALTLGALAVHLLFERRTFCRYVCPLNGWMSLYSMAAITEVRPADPKVCTTCEQRTCVTGTDSAWGCPWLMLGPFRLKRNNYCGLCMECVKSCWNKNMSVLVRPFCADRVVRRMDEAWMAFIMVTLAAAYSVTLLGPWPGVRDWANVTEVGDWTGFAIHAAVVWASALVLFPGLWYLASWVSARWLAPGEASVRDVFVRYSFMLVPLGLMAWVAFSLPLVLVNYTHISTSLSDPLGSGWNLFGTAGQRWEPLFPSAIPYIQAVALLGGLVAAVSSGKKVARDVVGTESRAVRSLLPHAAICIAFTLVLLRLYAG